MTANEYAARRVTDSLLSEARASLAHEPITRGQWAIVLVVILTYVVIMAWPYVFDRPPMRPCEYPCPTGIESPEEEGE